MTISATSDNMGRIPMFDREPCFGYQPLFWNRTTCFSRVFAHPTKCGANFPFLLSSTECAARRARNDGMAPNCWLHHQQALSGWNCHGRCAVSTCTFKASTVALHTQHCRSPDCTFLLFPGGAVSAVVGACCAASPGNCPLPPSS